MINRDYKLEGCEILPQELMSMINVTLSKRADVNVEVISVIEIGEDGRTSELKLTIKSDSAYDDYHK